MLMGLPRRTLSRLVSSLLSKVTQKVPSFSPMFTSVATVLGTILSEHKKMSKHKKGALYHPYDWSFDWLYAVSGLQCQRLQWWTYNGCQLLMKVSHESNIQGCVCKGRLWVLHSRVCLELYSVCKLPKGWMACLEHKLSCEFYTSIL